MTRVRRARPGEFYECYECDAEFDAGDHDECPECGEPVSDAPFPKQEDFHADG
jgi:rRNA maturation endonuclease Nob1